MRPEAPGRYRPSILERAGIGRLFGPPGRMVVRNVERQPVRTLTSIVGIALRRRRCSCSACSSWTHRRNPARAVHRGAAAGRHRRVRRAAVAGRVLRAAAPRRRPRGRTVARAGGAPPGRPPIAADRPDRRRSPIHGCSASSTRRQCRSRCRHPGWCCRDRSPRSSASAPASSSTSRCSRAAARATPCRSRRWSTSISACRPTWTSRPLHALMREAGVLSGAYLLVDRGAGGGALRPAQGHAGDRRRHAASAPRSRASRSRWTRRWACSSSSTSSSPASSPSAWSTTRRASRCRSAAASWPACAC